MHHLQRWSEDELSIRRKENKSQSQMPKNLQNANNPTQQKQVQTQKL